MTDSYELWEKVVLGCCYLMIASLLALLVWAVVWGIPADERWQRSCRDNGGVVQFESHGKTTHEYCIGAK